MQNTTQTPLEQWAHKAAQELASHATIVDWCSGSRRLEQVQIDGNDAIGYEWKHWHRQHDEGRAAGERINMLFDEYRKLTDRSA